MGTVRYTVVNGQVLHENRDGVKRDYLSDSLGSTMALVDNTQSKTDTFTYWPYGEERTRTGTAAIPFRYVGNQGYYRDSTSKSYARAREFGANLCRWLNVDPIGISSTETKPFQYCANNPVNFVDPAGLIQTLPLPPKEDKSWCIDCWGKCAAANPGDPQGLI